MNVFCVHIVINFTACKTNSIDISVKPLVPRPWYFLQAIKGFCKPTHYLLLPFTIKPYYYDIWISSSIYHYRNGVSLSIYISFAFNFFMNTHFLPTSFFLADNLTKSRITCFVQDLCNNIGLCFHLKRKKSTKVIGCVFQDEWRGKNHIGGYLQLINGYGNWHWHWQRQKAVNDNLMKEIKENRRKGRWRDKNMHVREIKEKIKENERKEERKGRDTNH